MGGKEKTGQPEFRKSQREQRGSTMEQMFTKQNPDPEGRSSRLKRFALATIVLVLCFAVPLYDLIWFSATSEFHSYILLIPFISCYLVWLKKESIPMCSRLAKPPRHF
jgi:Flp pilus assembly protein TadB